MAEKGATMADTNRAMELVRIIDKNVDKIFPSIKSTFDKSIPKQKETVLKELNDAIVEGSGEEVAKALEKQESVLAKINDRLINANGRTKKNLEEKKKEVELDIKMLEGRNKTLESDKLIN